MISNQEISELLGYLEDEEAKLLSWGYVDGGFSGDELYNVMTSWLEKKKIKINTHDAVDALVERKLIGEYQTKHGAMWRTRMSETIRLLAKIRQIFDAKDWPIAPTLISDFRFATRKRRYPARNIAVDQVMDEVKEDTDQKQIQVLEALLTREKPIELSRFQVNATKSMYRSLQGHDSRGMIVCAGTGTGKTLSFYIPALSSIASWIEEKEFWTKAVALYPRNELLKDQFLETYLEARRLDNYLLSEKKRKIRIGAIYGSVPHNKNTLKAFKWLEKEGHGYVCPFAKCPKEECQSEMVWRYEDIHQSKECLHCTTCEQIIEEDEIILTRERMKKEPPDVLFTTTEMMNKQMSDFSSRELLGIGVERAPRLVLLDEVHTYSGIHGAQVALLLRRWKHALRAPLHFTGLSATLEDAQAFFGQLINIAPSFVEEINVGTDLVEEGKEYQLILRGDPSSGTALLSATIQTAMLMRRALDLDKKRPSDSMFGSKVFLFTDDLDITNRLYDSLRDAEGYDKRGRSYKDPLAATRRHRQESAEALQQGQSWLMAEKIGHNLTVPIQLGRTSSQDVGVETNAQLIVATASLEVGFNDPQVGAVIQHKAPMDMASFLQRKGRAGRKRGMRPWTITVLSDFGRDRILYQGYEMLLDPVLKGRNLPLHNRYVLRMQSVYAFMDWLTEELKRREHFNKGSLWGDFAAPNNDTYMLQKRQKAASEIIDEVLCDTKTRERMENYLAEALSISEEELNAILWEPPRSLMLSVLPTLYRRLKTNWHRYPYKDNTKERYIVNHPLPEFIPHALFSDLTLPEIEITLEGEVEGQGQPNMPIVQALKSFAPGKVSRRFGNKSMKQSHWIAPPSLEESLQPYLLDVKQFCQEYEELGKVTYVDCDGTVVELPCIRPWTLQLTNTPSHVGTTSNATLIWKGQLNAMNEEENATVTAKIPVGTVWYQRIQGVYYYTHSRQSAVIVKRFTTGSEANIRHHQSQKSDIRMNFVRNHEPVALGFMLEADGIHFKINLPSDEEMYLTENYPSKLQSFRSLYFQHCVMEDTRLKGIANSFQLERLTETYLSALAATAIKQVCSLEEAFQMLQRSSFSRVCGKVLQVIFKTKKIENVSLEDEDQEDSESEMNDQVYQRAHEEILLLCERDEVAQVIYTHVPKLWSDLDDRSYKWARMRWLTTLGAAILQACKEISNQHAHDDLIVDVNIESQEKQTAEIWITEPTSGGGGIIEDILQKYQSDPRRFFGLVESALGPTDMELIDAELSRTLLLRKTDAELQEHFEKVRDLSGNSHSSEILASLQSYMRGKGILVTHAVMNSLYNRVLKPGSNKLTDDFISDLMELWKSEEQRLGIYMDIRVFGYVFSSSDEIVNRFKKALSHIDQYALQDPNWRFHVIVGILWPRGNQVRTRALLPHNPFVTYPPTDRELVLHGIEGLEVVSLSESSWWENLTTRLQQMGSARLVAKPEESDLLQQALLRLASEPIEIGFLHVYPRVAGLKREPEAILAALDIREV
ncbi:protein DpdJ [Paenibacillus sp. 37]|uniref:protein DpdJ n=1 Tax=Paenibacillus sp. 37 TaxID=2607911 RepID=UPI00122E8A81|nr:protein DpdJ [Paenibacillus sp. 37]